MWREGRGHVSHPSTGQVCEPVEYKESKWSPSKSIFRKKIEPLPRGEVIPECAPMSAGSVLSGFGGIFSHVSDDRCRFPAPIGREELTSSRSVLN